MVGVIAQGLICGAQALPGGEWPHFLALQSLETLAHTGTKLRKLTNNIRRSSFCCFKSIFTVPGEQRQPTNTEINYEKFY